jgi:hypothetical protein
MPTTIITTDDLREFKIELLEDLKRILKEQGCQTEQKQWLKSAEVRKLLNISPGTLQNLRVNGTLSFTRVGSIIFYSYAEIEKIINGNQINNSKQGSSKLHSVKVNL